jgi:hypothetical protein
LRLGRIEREQTSRSRAYEHGTEAHQPPRDDPAALGRPCRLRALFEGREIHVAPRRRLARLTVVHRERERVLVGDLE